MAERKLDRKPGSREEMARRSPPSQARCHPISGRCAALSNRVRRSFHGSQKSLCSSEGIIGNKTGIEWTDSTWNPIRGCSRVSEGCRNCYAEAIAARFSGPGHAYEGLAEFRVIRQGSKEERVEPHWTGELRLVEKHLQDPIHWKKPSKIFVNSMSDLFHPQVKEEWLAWIFDVMARAPQHTYQILTKRPDRMRDALLSASSAEVVSAFENTYRQEWPPKKWFFGISVEDQETASHRLKSLVSLGDLALNIFVSYEPALGPVNWFETEFADTIDWMICGGESGPHARPMSPVWARETKKFCEYHGIPFFFKQWGEWLPYDQVTDLARDCICDYVKNDTEARAYRVGKHYAGSSLDGIECKEFPQC
jgi:protein gp37